MDSSLDASTENAVGRKRLIVVIATILLIFLAVVGVVVAMLCSESKRRRACLSLEPPSHELTTIERQISYPSQAASAVGPSMTPTPPLTTPTSAPLSIPLESGPTASVVTSSTRSHVSTRTHEVEDPLARAGISALSPAPAHTHSTTTQPVNLDDENVIVFGSVQQRGLQRSHRPARLELSVDTLPPYEEPPSYHTEDGFSAPAERV